MALFRQIIYFSPGKITKLYVYAEPAAVPTLQNTNHLKNIPEENKGSHRLSRLFSILFIKTAITYYRRIKWTWVLWQFSRDEGSFPPAFNLEAYTEYNHGMIDNSCRQVSSLNLKSKMITVFAGVFVCLSVFWKKSSLFSCGVVNLLDATWDYPSPLLW